MPDATRVIITYQDRVAAVRARVLTYVERVWRSLPNYRDADIERFVRAVVPVVSGGQRQVAALTDSYMASFETIVLGRAVRPVGVAAEAVTDLRGVPADEVYRRAGPTVWTALAKGTALSAAVAMGLERAQAMAATDLQLAKTHASKEVLGRKDNVTGYRRVLSGGACDLCDSVGDEVYATDDLMPIHADCNCDVEPVYETDDPDVAPDVPTEDTDRVGDSSVVVQEHGEIGPVLVVADHKFSE